MAKPDLRKMNLRQLTEAVALESAKVAGKMALMIASDPLLRDNPDAQKPYIRDFEAEYKRNTADSYAEIDRRDKRRYAARSRVFS